MATLTTAAKALAMQAIADACDGGRVEFGTAGFGTVLATFNLSTPAETSVVGGLITFDFDPDITATASASGTAAEARVVSADSTVLVDGLTIDDSGTPDFSLPTTTIASGVDLTIASFTLNLTDPA